MAAGDLNNDGFEDLIIGAYLADPDGRTNAGQTYVLFGPVATGTLALSTTTADVIVNGIDPGDLSGRSVAAGDVNDDGLEDLVIGAYYADPGGRVDAGETYVVFGPLTSGTVELSDGAHVTFNGIDPGDRAGVSVAIGDVNGDGAADLAIGAYYADPDGRADAGEIYVVFGPVVSTTVELSSSADVTVNGADPEDLAGVGVSTGDVSGDGADDVIIGALLADPGGTEQAGKAYVIFGPVVSSTVELSTDPDITVNGIAFYDQAGGDVGAGDINDDDIGDLIIGAYLADPPGLMCAGETYVIFGPLGAGTLELFTSADVTLNGVAPEDYSGIGVAAGDLNDDGADDLIVGAAFADPDGKMDAGETYVIFGPLSTTTAAAPTTTPTGTPTSTPLLEPGPENQVLPLFGKPFSGDFWYGSIFDHNLPLQWGEDFNEFVLTWWGETSSVNYDTHMGIDWVMPEGTPILAVADGEVVFAGIDPPGACPPLGVDATDQQRIILLHFAENGMRFTSSYLHGSTIDVQLGEAVSAGQQIALSGNTGCSTEPHLHFHVGRLGDTNSGEPALVDPYGWESDQTDPWSQHPDGAESIWLWKEGQAPPIYAGYAIPPNPFGGSSPVALTVFRWMGPRDSESPNNEMLQLELDPRYAPSGEYDLTGFSIHNIRGDSFLFPDDFLIGQDQPVWLFTGSGTSTDTVLYWGRSEGVWDNTRDCAFLAWPDGSTMYHLRTSDTCDALPAQTPPSVPGLTGPALVGMALLMSALALWRLRMPARRSGGRDARNELGRALE